MQEPSEEVRLQLMTLTLRVLGQGGPDMHASLPALVSTASAAVNDPSPDIKRACPRQCSLATPSLPVHC